MFRLPGYRLPITGFFFPGPWSLVPSLLHLSKSRPRGTHRPSPMVLCIQTTPITVKNKIRPRPIFFSPLPLGEGLARRSPLLCEA